MAPRSLFRLSALLLLAAFLLLSQVTPPAEHFGFTPGDDYKLADYEQIRGYFELLARQSDRMKVVDLGPSSEGRPMLMAVVSSPENLARLDELQQIQRKLALGEATGEEARKLAAQGKAVVWIDCTMHSTEVAPAQHAPLLAHKLLSEESDEIRRILQNVVLLLVPVTNPDGTQWIVDWYRKNVGTEYELAPFPGLYQKYSGHDNNRDWYMLNLQETRNVSKVLYQEWFPHIVYNQHQTPPFPARIFVPPYAEPMNPAIPPAVMEGINLIGQAMKERLALEGKPGAVSYLSFDGWWNGGLRTTPAFHNMHGILTETAGFLYATPYDYDSKRFPKTFANGVPTDKPSIFYPYPWKGGRWSLRDAVDYNITASMAVLSLASSMPEHWSLKAWRLARQQIEAGRSGGPYAYVISSNQWDVSSAHELVRRLQMNGVQVERADAAFSADGKQFPAGSYVIPAAQPFRAYLMDLLEPHNYPEIRLNGGPVKTPYDSSGYTLSLQMGVDVVRVNDLFQASLSSLEQLAPPAPVWDRKQNASFLAIAEALRNERPVQMAADGSFLSSGQGGVAAKTSKPAFTLRKPRVAVYQPYRSDMDGGWTQWMLDNYGVPFTPLRNEVVRNGKLREQFDTIIIASQSTDAIMHGYQAGVPTLSSRITNDEALAARSMQRPEYTGGIAVDGVVALREFVEQGGTLITFGAATELPIRMFPLPVSNVASGGSFRAPGAVIRLNVDTRNPLAAGMPEQSYGFVSGGYAFQPTALKGKAAARSEVRALASYATRDLLASGWLAGENAVKGKDAVTEVKYGNGRVLLFGIRPQFRGQTFATFKLILNAVYLASAKAE